MQVKTGDLPNESAVINEAQTSWRFEKLIVGITQNYWQYVKLSQHKKRGFLNRDITAMTLLF